MTPQQELQRAREAQQLIETPLFQEARKAVYDALASARRQAHVTATELHTRLILTEQIADQFFGHFEQIAATGKLAAEWLRQEEERGKSWRERLDVFRKIGRGGL